MPLRLALVLAALAGFASAAVAQPSKDPAKIQAGSYPVDPDHTQILFGVNHLGFSTYFGRFSGFSGTLTLDPEHPASSMVEISFPTASISTTSTQLDERLKGADWLDAEKYPTITFRSTSVKPTGTDSASVTGDLTLHGATHPVILRVTLNGGGPDPFFRKPTVGFQANGALKRSDFGVKTYLPAIGDDISLTISAAFVKP